MSMAFRFLMDKNGNTNLAIKDVPAPKAQRSTTMKTTNGTTKAKGKATPKNPPLQLRIGSVKGKSYTFTPKQFFSDEGALIGAVKKALSGRTSGLREIVIAVHD